MKNILRIFAAATVIVLGVAAVGYLQYRFDRSDLEHAVQAVRVSRPEGPMGKTLEEILADRYEVSREQIFWVPRLESKFRGTVVVEAFISGKKKNLLWKVDLVRFNIVPISSEAKALEKE